MVLACLSLFAYSSSVVVSYIKEAQAVDEVNENLMGLAVEVQDNEDEQQLPVFIDFNVLKEENNDIVAWLYCEDTPINYPVVQAKNNDYYLRRLINGKWNIAGTLFIDFRNSAKFCDLNTVIYGHNMDNDTMFGSIPDYSKQEYYEKHPEIYLFTPDKNYVIELFAGYVTDVNSKIYDFPFDEENFSDFVSESINKSGFVSDVVVENNDKIVSLSTCYYTSENSRYVLLGRLKEI